MAPSVPSVSQRVEELEDALGNIESRVTDLVSQAVEKAVDTMKHSLVELLLQGQVETSKKYGGELESLGSRLEGRLSRAREHQEALIYSMKTDLDQFQSEVRSSLASLSNRPPPFQPNMDKLDSGAPMAGSSFQGGGHSSHRGSAAEGLFQSPMMERGFSGGGGSGGGPGYWKYRKLDMPIFDGSDPDGWLLRVERYFNFYKLSEEERLEAVVVALEGDALRWFQWENKRHPIRRWDDLKLFILRQFRPALGGSLYEQWLATTQETTVAEYRRRFIETAAPLDRVPESILMGQFLNGLSDVIKAEVRLWNPVSLEQAMEMALRVEERNQVTAGKKFSGISPKTGSYSASFKAPSAGGTSLYSASHPAASIRSWATQAGESQNSVSSPKLSVSSPNKGGELRRLSDKELQEKRARGLCFKCDEKWSQGHRCKKKELSVLVIDDEEDEGLDGGSSEAPMSPPEELVPEVTTQPEVSLNSVVGLSNPKTMKLRGVIKGNEVVVLIDPGATHNFISLAKVGELHLPITDAGGFGVSLGNGEAVRGHGLCKGVNLQLAGSLEIKDDFLPLQLGSADIILGIQWLETLGNVTSNWKTQVMQFDIEGRTITLVGDPTLVHSQISLKAMLRTLRKTGGGYYVEMNQVEAVQLVNDGVDVKNEGAEATVPVFLAPVLADYEAVFRAPVGLPPVRGHEHSIILKEGAGPVGVRPYRYPQSQKDEIERLIQEMLAAGIIKPSKSPFSSPVLLVKKRDGSWRFCVDYRALNKETIPDKYPIPIIEELLDELHGARIFSKLDLKAGYHQILVQPEDTHKTAFRTHDGHYEFLVMPFGLMNAPSTFQSLMNDIFRPFLRKYVLVFFDDILIYSKSEVEHCEHMRQVLEALATHKLVVNQKKCVFGKTAVAYLGHTISGQGVAVDSDKVQAILEWPQPTSLKELRGFLGLTGYYRKYVRHYAQIAQPLTDQLRKEAFGWTAKATEAFENLKTAMVTPPVLAMPNFSQPFVLETDASGYGVGAVLMQNDRPIAYFSKLLGTRAQQKSVYEKELMAICLAVQKWRYFLLGRHFIVRTDQQSLRYMTQQREIGADYQRWVSKLLGYSFEIQYKPGCSNRVADALSRKSVGDIEFGSLVSTSVVDWSLLDQEVSRDPLLTQLKREILLQEKHHVGFSVREGKLLYKDRFVIPRTSTFIPKLLQVYHDSVVGGHSGEIKTYLRIAAEWYWIGLRKDVSRFVQQCTICQRNKVSQQSPMGLLQPLPIPNQVWEDISMDFIEGLPVSNGFNSVLVVVDRFSKYAHFIPLRHPFTAVTVAEVFIKEIVKLHGFPATIISDRDKVFLSLFWQELFKAHGTQLRHSTAYHPQTDGQTEIVNKALESYLRCFAGSQPRKWVKWIHWAEFSYNTSTHSSTKFSPFKVLYGRDPPLFRRVGKGQSPVDSVETLLQERDCIVDDLRFHLLRAQHIMKFNADKGRRDVQFEVGDMVYVKLQPYRQRSLARRPFEKLAARFYGPFEIVKRVGNVAYKLQLPESSKIHPVFHISQLKKAVGTQETSAHIPDQLSVDMELVVQPELVLNVRHRPQGESLQLEVLLKWKGLPEFEATWEDVSLISERFPEFHLEDKVKVWEGGNVMSGVQPHALRTYQRKKQKMQKGKEVIEQKKG